MNALKINLIISVLPILFCFPTFTHAQGESKSSDLKLQSPHLTSISTRQDQSKSWSLYIQANGFDSVSKLRFLKITNELDSIEEKLDRLFDASQKAGDLANSTLVKAYYRNLSFIKQNVTMLHRFKPSYKFKEFGAGSFSTSGLHSLKISMKWE